MVSQVARFLEPFEEWRVRGRFEKKSIGLLTAVARSSPIVGPCIIEVHIPVSVVHDVLKFLEMLSSNVR